MELKELKKKKTSDLHRILSEQRDKLRDLRFKDANKQLKDIRQIRKVRQTISRCLTLLNNTQNKRKATKTTKDIKS
ncbi:50S ribosomal protein L29 [Candidatus Parcubacteria bacterium]|nr:50S ribosomal protein L29 [Candidatus Parcubacteria bacterium]